MQGSLGIGEVEDIMRFGRDITQGIYLEGVELSESQRWRVLGNASVMCHIMVSALVTRGYITRDSHLIQSQLWTMDLDGPAAPSLGELLAESARVLQQTAMIKKASGQKRKGRAGKVMAAGGLQSALGVKAAGSGGVVNMMAKSGRESQSKTMMRWATSVEDQGGMEDWTNLSWGKVYDTVDAKGVPRLQLMERKMGKYYAGVEGGGRFMEFHRHTGSRFDDAVEGREYMEAVRSMVRIV